MKKSLLFVALMLLIVNTFSLFGIFASAETAVLTEAYLLNEGNWTNLPGYEYVSPDVKDENGKILSFNDPRTAIERSKTYPGIAEAMGNQWNFN